MSAFSANLCELIVSEKEDDANESTEINLSTAGLADPIPRLIHQTWKTAEVPEKYGAYCKSFKESNPRWQYKLWTDEDNEKLITDHYPWFLPFYTGYHHNIQRADAARYFILFHYGGMYADLDMQCLTSLDPLLDQISGVIVGQEGQLHTDGTPRIGNAIIFSSPHHPFWLHVFQSLVENFNRSDPAKLSTVFITTGPTFLHEVYVRYPQGITVMPVTAFYPIPWHNPGEHKDGPMSSRRQHPKSWAVHHWDGVWRNEPRQVMIQYQDASGSGKNFKMNFVVPRQKEVGYGVVEQSLMRGYLHREELVRTWSEILHPGDNVIQVGAYIGYLTVPLAKLIEAPLGSGLQSGIVHAFEPDSRARQLLSETVRLNKLNNVYIYDVMPSSQTIRLYRVNKINPLKPHRIIWRSQPPNGVDCCLGTPLDAVLVENCSLIHIDANGEELETFRGGELVIKRDRPIITIDILTEQRRQEYGCPIRQDQVFKYLEKLNYHYTVIESSTYLCTPEEMEESTS